MKIIYILRGPQALLVAPLILNNFGLVTSK